MNGADHILLNDAYMRGGSQSGRRMVGTHELGHGMGIDDFVGSVYNTQVMYEHHTTIHTLGGHDILDFRERWGVPT
jgi:hypothetical protein